MKFLQSIGIRLFSILILTAGLGWIWYSAVPVGELQNRSLASPQTGFLAPDFTLKTLDGQDTHLADLRGKVVLLNIWASWCPPCKAEMPAIQLVYTKYKGSGFVVLGINSTIQDTRANSADFVTRNALSFPILYDDRGLVTRLYRVESLPTSYFIDRAGIIREIVVGGPMAEALLTTRIEKLLQAVP